MSLGEPSERLQAALAVCDTFVATVPVDGAAFTEMASDLARNTLCTSDSIAAQVESLQYSLGEGPTYEAFVTRRPQLVPDVADPACATRWPVFMQQAAHLEIGALFAIPMRLGAITAGVCTTYRRASGLLSISDLRTLLSAVDAATLALLAIRSGVAEAADGFDAPDPSLPRSVHQATGMVIAQLGLGAESAFARLRAHAYITGRTLQDISDDVVERRLRLDADPPPIQFG